MDAVYAWDQPYLHLYVFGGDHHYDRPGGFQASSLGLDWRRALGDSLKAASGGSDWDGFGWNGGEGWGGGGFGR